MSGEPNIEDVKAFIAGCGTNQKEVAPLLGEKLGRKVTRDDLSKALNERGLPDGWAAALLEILEPKMCEVLAKNPDDEDLAGRLARGQHYLYNRAFYDEWGIPPHLGAIVTNSNHGGNAGHVTPNLATELLGELVACLDCAGQREALKFAALYASRGHATEERTRLLASLATKLEDRTESDNEPLGMGLRFGYDLVPITEENPSGLVFVGVENFTMEERIELAGLLKRIKAKRERIVKDMS